MRFWLGVCFGLVALSSQAAENKLPPVRAITAFVRLDLAAYHQQIDEALVVLRQVQEGFAQRGYEVETIRIVTQPLAELTHGLNPDQAMSFLKQIDSLAAQENFIPDVGPAMMNDADDPAMMALLTKALITLPHINGSVIIAAEDGIHWRAIRETAKLVLAVSQASPNSQSNFNFTATAMLAPYGPFYPGAYHSGPGRKFSLGFEGAALVQQVFAASRGDFDLSVRSLTQKLQTQTDVAMAVGLEVEKNSSWQFMGVDPTPAPLGDSSIGDAIEHFTGSTFGSSGTMTAALAITSAVKAVKGRIIGYAGLMLPVLEDKRLAERWAENRYEIDSLLAYSAVCGTGLDTVPLPGDVS